MQSLTEQIWRLAPPGGICDETVVRNLYPEASAGARRQLVHRAVGAGELLRMKPGLFVLAEAYRKSEVHPFALAALLHGPSHVSLESALAYHGLIPEAVYQVSSVTAVRSREYRTPLGVFSYQRVPASDPRAGVEAVKLPDGAWAFVATPLRAIADRVYLNRAVSWKKDGIGYLTESLRLEPEEVSGLSFRPLRAICRSVRSRRVVGYLQGLKEAVEHGC